MAGGLDPRRQAGGGIGNKHIVVLLAGLICMLNLYMYLAPAGSRNFERPEQGAAEVLMASGNFVEGPQAGPEPAGKRKAVFQVPFMGKKARDKSKQKNVLFVMTDDLRPSLSIYDKPVVTPAFERLAKQGVVFERAYNQDPICNPSRNSLLSGRRPDTTRVWLFEHTVPHEYRYVSESSLPAALRRASTET